MKHEQGAFIVAPDGGIVRHYVIHECCRTNISHKAEYREGSMFHTCKEHGEVQLVPVYVPKEAQVTGETRLFCYWACPMCIIKEYGDLVEVEARVCVQCYDKYNLTQCNYCKKSVCPKHHIAGACFDCISEQSIGDGAFN